MSGELSYGKPKGVAIIMKNAPTIASPTNTVSTDLRNKQIKGTCKNI